MQKRVTSWWLLVPLAFVAWALVHASGVHATVAGVLLGFTVPVLLRDGEEGRGLAEHLEHVVRPLSAAVAVPIFAFFSAGVAIDGWDELAEALRDPITVGVVLGLVAGKTLGVFGTTWLASTFTHARLDDDLSWWDVLGLSMLGGVGFTVSLLIGELAFGLGSEADERAKVGVLVGSLCWPPSPRPSCSEPGTGSTAASRRPSGSTATTTASRTSSTKLIREQLSAIVEAASREVWSALPSPVGLGSTVDRWSSRGLSRHPHPMRRTLPECMPSRWPRTTPS